MSEIVVNSYLPKEGERPYRSEKLRVVALPCEDNLDYCRGLQAVWEGDHTIVNVEHDMECNDELIQQLLDCPEPACTHAYRMRGLQGHYCHRTGPLPPAGGQAKFWLTPGSEWAAFGGIGFCKITPEARVRPLGLREWSYVDIAVAHAIEGREGDKRWHVHWPGVDHYHGLDA